MGTAINLDYHAGYLKGYLDALDAPLKAISALDVLIRAAQTQPRNMGAQPEKEELTINWDAVLTDTRAPDEEMQPVHAVEFSTAREQAESISKQCLHDPDGEHAPPKKGAWSIEEKDQLMAWHKAGMSPRGIATRLNRPETAVKAQINNIKYPQKRPPAKK